MFKTMGKSRRVFALSLLVAVLGSLAFAKKKDNESVKEEAGYYYGYGNASTKEEAESMGRKDLVETALTSTLRLTNPKAPRISVSAASAAARVKNVKPFASNKAGTNVTFRISVKDWEKEEEKFAESLRKTLSPKYESLSSKTKIAEKLNEAVVILNELASNGETELLTVQPKATELMARRVEAVCADAVKNLVLTVGVKDGFTGPETKYTVNASDSSGKAVSGLILRAVFEKVSLAESEEGPLEVVSSVKTDSLGNANVDYPVAEEFKNTAVTLTVSTAFSDNPLATKAMKKLDAQSSVDGCFVRYEDFTASFDGAKVPAGEFNAGAVSHDSKARKAEAAHTVTTGAYVIDFAPVTNAQFAAYLHATRAETKPEYLDNTDYNAPDQPVVGVSLEDALAYAAWLSEQTGWTFRLPTEEEWEKAARAGKEVIYPWGDEAPNKNKAANYKGNGKFKNTSPVGAFENGKNEWGLSDMSGNVWEWTSSKRTAQEDSPLCVVKGGSWMDGPADLRISNYRELDSTAGYPDTGFRLVRDEQ